MLVATLPDVFWEYTLGEAENIVLQFGAIRSIHGWHCFGSDASLMVLKLGTVSHLFKIVYLYPRPDAGAHSPGATGFLAEIVYGSDYITEKLALPHQLEPFVYVFNSLGEAIGVLNESNALRDYLGRQDGPHT